MSIVQPLTSRFIPADILTSNHFIFGQIKVTNTMMMGLLSDVNSSYVEINEASMARILKPDKVINYTPVMWLVKEQIVAVSLNKREYIGAQALARGGFSRIFAYAVQMTTPVYELTGTLEWAGRFEISALMGEGTNAFFVLFDAVVTASLFPALHVEAPALLVNRQFLDTIVTLRKNE